MAKQRNKVAEEILNNLRFADDVIIIEKGSKELKKMVLEYMERGAEAVLNINLGKTKILRS